MTREEFCKYHWEYFLVLEKDLLDIERYISFDLGDDNFYISTTPTEYGNSKCFSNEFVKQYQAICSEVDVLLKTICCELGNTSAEKMDTGYTPTVLNRWPDIINQKVQMKNGTDLQPFINWKNVPNYQSPDWWTPYNKVKHKRIENYKSANLKNVLNALAGLYVLEIYLAKFIGDRDGEYDVPNDISKLFSMVNYSTNREVVGRDAYLTNQDDINEMFS